MKYRNKLINNVQSKFGDLLGIVIKGIKEQHPVLLERFASDIAFKVEEIEKSNSEIVKYERANGLENEELIQKIWCEYEKTEKGKPQVSEYNRLIQEFINVSDIYREKIEKLRQKESNSKVEVITKIVDEVIGNG